LRFITSILYECEMWRHIKGVSNPNKRKNDDKKDKDKTYNKEYESLKRQRTAMMTKWEVGRPWLEISECGLKMICRSCKKYSQKESQFISGCGSKKLDSVNKHEKSSEHKRCLEIEEAKRLEPDKSQAAQIIRTLNGDIFEKLEKMFRTCHAIVVHNRPITDFVWMCDLVDMMGLNLGKTYRNRISAKEFTRAIAEVEFRQMAQETKDANFVCVLGDGSQDSSVTEQEMWFVRTAVKGDIAVKFLGISATEKATAANIANGLKLMVEKNLAMDWRTFAKKMVGLGCDGAQVMVGCRSGVAAILKESQPALVTVHCLAHRLELALKDAAKKIGLYDKTIQVLLMGLYYFYHNSSLNRSMLRRAYDAAASEEDGPLLLPTRAHGTRWIGHLLRAITNLMSSYKYITLHLGQV